MKAESATLGARINWQPGNFKEKESRMKEYISFDSHKHYTLAEREDVDSGWQIQCRVEHRRGAIRSYLGQCERGTAVAVEATGNWYWIVGEIEEAGMCPLLVHPRKALDSIPTYIYSA